MVFDIQKYEIYGGYPNIFLEILTPAFPNFEKAFLVYYGFCHFLLTFAKKYQK